MRNFLVRIQMAVGDFVAAIRFRNSRWLRTSWMNLRQSFLDLKLDIGNWIAISPDEG